MVDLSGVADRHPSEDANRTGQFAYQQGAVADIPPKHSRRPYLSRRYLQPSHNLLETAVATPMRQAHSQSSVRDQLASTDICPFAPSQLLDARNGAALLELKLDYFE
jgi:hypothetical protein